MIERQVHLSLTHDPFFEPSPEKWEEEMRKLKKSGGTWRGIWVRTEVLRWEK